jgi:hypothetical protein
MMIKLGVRLPRHSKRTRSVSEVSDLEPRFDCSTRKSWVPNHSFRCATLLCGMTVVFGNLAEEFVKLDVPS